MAGDGFERVRTLDAPAVVVALRRARGPHVELVLATLAFDLTWRSPGRLQQRVEQHLVDTAPPDVFRAVWAHASLRLLDWSIRHYPEHVDAWLAVARRHLDP